MTQLHQLGSTARRSTGACASVAFALLVVGCAPAATQLVVVIDSDLDVPGELSSVEITTSHEGQLTSEFTFQLAREAGAPARYPLPFSFGVVPRGGEVERRVRIVATGHDSLGMPVVERSALVGFIEGQRLRLPLFLPRSCVRVECPAGQTCTREGCVPEEIDPGTLTPTEPGEELDFDSGTERADGGARDAASRDAWTAIDAPLSDAWTPAEDSGPTPIDTGTAPSDGGTRPTCDSCAAMGSECASVCSEEETCRCGDRCPCGIECVSGDDCEVECTGGAACTIDARDVSNADIRCESGASCDVRCDGTSNCFTECRTGATCSVDCTGTSNCRYTACSGGMMSCPGDVIVCNRACP